MPLTSLRAQVAQPLRSESVADLRDVHALRHTRTLAHIYVCVQMRLAVSSLPAATSAIRTGRVLQPPRSKDVGDTYPHGTSTTDVPYRKGSDRSDLHGPCSTDVVDHAGVIKNDPCGKSPADSIDGTKQSDARPIALYHDGVDQSNLRGASTTDTPNCAGIIESYPYGASTTDALYCSGVDDSYPHGPRSTDALYRKGISGTIQHGTSTTDAAPWL